MNRRKLFSSLAIAAIRVTRVELRCLKRRTSCKRPTKVEWVVAASHSRLVQRSIFGDHLPAAAPGKLPKPDRTGFFGVVSLPDRNSDAVACGGVMLRTRCGVISSMISVFWMSSFWLLNKRPTTGMSPRPGIPLEVRVSWSLIRPASTWVSPSRMRSTADALRVPIW